MNEQSRIRLAEEASLQAFQFVVSLVFTAPLAANWVGDWLGWRIFFLADPKIQLVWATILLGAGGWPFFRGAWRRTVGDTVVGLAIAILYAYGCFLTVWRPAVTSHPYFQIQALLIFLVTTWRLSAALVRHRRARRSE